MMVVTRHAVGEKLLAYLNSEITLAQLVDWAENTFIDAELQPDTDIELLNGILGYLAAADSDQFPLTWDICSEFLSKLGIVVKVIAQSA